MPVQRCCHRKPPNELKPGVFAANAVGHKTLLEQVCPPGFDGRLLSSLTM
jgi:hypothetical protein